MYPAQGSPNSIPQTREGKSLLYGEGHFLHDLQVVATYETHERWTGFVPGSERKLLPKTAERLQDRAPIQLVVLGDSISVGKNASAVVGANQACHRIPIRLPAGWEALGASRVVLTNLSVAGTTSEWGVARAPDIVAAHPDLLIIAFGVNDAGEKRITPSVYMANIRTIVQETQRALPTCEVILVASLIANPDWSAVRQDRFPEFRDRLKQLQGPGIALADVTSVWADLRRRKSFYDVSGNGVNHPNDFGHRVYADVILALVGG